MHDERKDREKPGWNDADGPASFRNDSSLGYVCMSCHEMHFVKRLTNQNLCQ
jgi:hypothetical protein